MRIGKPCSRSRGGRWSLSPRILAFPFLVFGVFSPALRSQTVAIVTSVEGKSVVTRSGGETDAFIGMELASGDVFDVRSGSASLVFLHGELLGVKSGERVTVGTDPASTTLNDAGGVRGVGREEVVPVAAGGVTPVQGKDYLSQLAVMSGVRGEATVVALSPRLTISDPEPVFVWFDTDSAEAGSSRSYLLLVRDGGGNIVFRKEVEGNVYAMNTFRLERREGAVRGNAGEHYTWAVFRTGNVPEPLPAFDAAFVYVDRGGLENAREKRSSLDALRTAGRIDEQAYHTLLVLFSVDERERLFGDAVPHLLRIAEMPEGRSFAESMLAGILPRFGNQAAVAAACWLESRGSGR